MKRSSVTSISIVVLLLLSLLSCSRSDDVKVVEIAKGDDLQDRTLTEQMFASMREGGVSPDQPLLWGYFFYGEERGLREVWDQL